MLFKTLAVVTAVCLRMPLIQLYRVIGSVTRSISTHFIRMAGEYTDGYWHFYTLSIDGFYIAPAEEKIFHVDCQIIYEGSHTVDALGMVACLYACCNLSFSLSDTFREQSRHYGLLMKYMVEHPEEGGDPGAID